MANIQRLDALGARCAFSGHGAVMTDPAASFAAAHARYNRWVRDPDRVAWHAAKRIFAFALMLRGSLAVVSAAEYLLSCSWFNDISRHAMRIEPREFVEPFLREMLRSGGAVAVEGVLRAAAAHDLPPPGWARAPTTPDRWPPSAIASRS